MWKNLLPTIYVTAYAEYPVVGVNWMQAVQFAGGTDRVNEFILEREQYLEKDTRYNPDVVDANSTFSTSAC